MIKKKYHSIQEVFEIVRKLELSTKRLPELLGFRSSDISRCYKRLISLCNSLSIIFQQYELSSLALELLKKASEADKGLKRYGTSSDRLWQGSLIISCNLALLFHRAGQYSSSLKLIYEAQSFLVSIRENGEVLSPDIQICVHMITFVALWKLKKYAEASEYLEIAADILNKIIQGNEESKMSKSSCSNLYTIIVMSLSGLKICIEKDLNTAKDMCEDCKTQLEHNSLSFKMISEFISNLNEVDKGIKDCLITEMYQKILFVTTFMPLISLNTPLIKTNELEDAKEKGLGNEKSEGFFRRNMSKEKIEAKMSRKNVKSTPRANYLIKPWWENNKIIDRPLKSSKNNSRPEKAFRSEPRPLKIIPTNPENKQRLTPYFAPKLAKPYSKESFYTDLSKEKEQGKEDGFIEKGFMFDFNINNEPLPEFEIQLAPSVIFNQKKQNSKERPFTNHNFTRAVY